MKWVLCLFLLFLAQIAGAESLKILNNQWTGRFDYITRIDTSTTYGFAAVQLQDSAQCIWSTTVNTSGVLVTTLVSCPAAPGFILLEDGTFILQEDGTKILTE